MSEIRVDTISEKTSANGVAIDSVTLKDGGIAATAASTITTADNTDTLTLTSTDADAGVGPNINMFRNSGSVAANDYLGTIAFSGKDDAGNIHDYVIFETQAETVTNGGEDGSLYISSFIDGSSVARLSFDKTEAVFNDGSVDLDFRVESNSHTHMLFVDGGNNRVGVKLEPDLGDGLHIKTADSGASSNVNFDELVIEGSSASGLCVLTPNDQTGGIAFGDNNDNDRGRIAYDHSNDRFFIDTNGNDVPAMFFHSSNALSTSGETAPDVGEGGITLDQNANDDAIISLKSSDVAHGVTSGLETDTYATLRKQSATKGGLQIRTIAEDNPNERLVINVTGDGDVTESTSTSTKGAMCITSSNKSGTGEASMNANGNILSIANYTATRFLFEGNGEFHADASSNTFDEYEDAHLVRAYDLSHGRGVIDSKFDKFVSYNHQKLADLKLVGKEKDGTPNHFVNVTGFQRLHNGAIWQQYEKHQRLAEAVYEMAKETLGKDKADAILEKHDIKLLN